MGNSTFIVYTLTLSGITGDQSVLQSYSLVLSVPGIFTTVFVTEQVKAQMTAGGEHSADGPVPWERSTVWVRVAS